MKNGRPPNPVKPTQVRKLASKGLTNRDIADVFDLHESNVARRFERELVVGRANMRQRLRQKQMDVAMNGSVPMLIWLGKNILEQSDRQTHEHSGEVTFGLAIGPELRRHENSNGNGHRITQTN